MIENASLIREKRKSIRITITPNGELVVYCPYGMKNDKIEQVLQSKKNILNKKIQSIKAVSQKYSNIINREYILIFGKNYAIVPSNKIKKPAFTEEYFLIPKKYITENKVDYIIKKTVKEMAQRVINRRLNDIKQSHEKYEINKVIIGDYKAKWGSCDNFGVIKFNWRVAMLSPKLVDFVIFHELTHLKELNHSPKFYLELSKVYPTWKESREALKEFSFLLSIY